MTEPIVLRPLLFSTRQAAQILNCSERTVREYIRQGRLAAVKPGRVLRVRQSDIDAFLANLTPLGDEPPMYQVGRRA
jgi:excisionase family DNA binding protein